jgi:hypothetical protein
VPSSTLHAQVPTACGLTALAYCPRCTSFVGLGLTGSHGFLSRSSAAIFTDVVQLLLREA